MSEKQDLSQALIDAMTIMVDYNNSRLTKDETVECEIIRKINVEKGEFRVRYLNDAFSAFAASSDLAKNLEVGDMVYLLIPQGDTSQRKIIQGKTGKISSQRLNDITLDIERINTSDVPFESLYNFINNDSGVQYNSNEELGIYGSTNYTSIIYKAERTDEKDKIFQNYAQGNTLLFISGKFRTNWYRTESYIEKGDYGIKVKFRRKNDGTIIECKLNRDAMIGNSLNYSQLNGYENYVLLQIDGGSLEAIESIEFYAEKFTRTDFNETELETRYNNGEDSEIFVKDLRIEFVEYSDVDGYIAYITTPQTNSFDGKESLNLVANLKYNGQIIPGFEKNAKFYWFEQDSSVDLSHEGYSEYGGLGWRKLDDKDNVLTLYEQNFKDKRILKKNYKVVILYNEYKLNAKKEIFYRIDDMSQFKINLELAPDGRIGDLTVSPNWEQEGYTTQWQSEDINGSLTLEPSDENFILRNIDIANIYISKKFICTIYYGEDAVYSLERTIYNTSSLQDVNVKFITDDNGIYHYDEVGNYARDIRKTIDFVVDIKQQEGSEDILHWNYEWGYPENIESSDLMFTLISSGEELKGTDLTENKQINFNIKEKFDSKKIEDNVIQLKITIGDKDYYFYKELSFTKEGDQGTNGSSLVMKVDIIGNNRAILADGITQSTLKFEIDMQKDGEGSFQEKNIVEHFSFSVSVPADYKLDNPLSETFEPQTFSLNNNKVAIQFPIINNLNQKNAIIQFRATPKPWVDAEHFPHDVLYLMPIALTNNFEYQAYEYIGPTIVQYDERGYNGKWDNSSLKLVDSTGKDTEFSFKPYGNLTMTEENAIVPPSYYDPNNLIMGVITSDESYVQPIVGSLNAFSKAILNAWDGSSIEINEENGGYVLASQVGAGIKDTNTNTFTGVLMGQLSNRKDSSDQNYGLLGFYQGESTFGFLSDGSGYIGASGKGRINFNPKQGSAIIQSGDFVKDEAGMQIDLSKGYINAASFSLESSGLTIVSDGSLKQGTRRNLFSFDIANVNGDTGYFKVHNGKSDMIYLSGTRQYIQSSNYYTSDGEKGIYIDLDNGSLQSPNFFIDSNGNASFEGSINVNNKFIVDGSTGNVSILGNLTLSNGAISWSDLGTDVKNEINNLVPTLPSYIKSTYIDSTTVQSPTIIGGSLTSETTNYKTIIENGALTVWYKSGSFTFRLGDLLSYTTNSADDNTSDYGLKLKSYSDGSGGRSALKIHADKNLALDGGSGKIYFTDSENTTISLSELRASSGGGVAVFG